MIPQGSLVYMCKLERQHGYLEGTQTCLRCSYLPRFDLNGVEAPVSAGLLQDGLRGLSSLFYFNFPKHMNIDHQFLSTSSSFACARFDPSVIMKLGLKLKIALSIPFLRQLVGFTGLYWNGKPFLQFVCC